MNLNYRRTALVGLAFFSICAFWQMYDNIIPLLLKNTFHLSDTLNGAIMALDNVLALFLLPLFGAWSDKVSTPIGRRMPFIVCGTGAAVVFCLLLPMADYYKNLPLFILFLGCALLAMGSYRSPAVALMPDVTPKPLRSQGNAVINLMGALGGVFTLIITGRITATYPDGRDNYSLVFYAVAALMIISVGVLFATVRENKLSLGNGSAKEQDIAAPGGKMPAPVRRSLALLLVSVFLWFMAYNAVTTAYSRYVHQQLGIIGGGFANSMLIGTVAAVISYLPVGVLSARFGRKKMILFGVGLMTVAYAVAFTLKSCNWQMYLVLILVGIGWASINVNSYPMVVQMATGNTTGRYTGLYYTFSMAAQTITPILSGALFDITGSYKLLFPYAALFSLLALFTMAGVTHGDTIPQKGGR